MDYMYIICSVYITFYLLIIIKMWETIKNSVSSMDNVNIDSIPALAESVKKEFAYKEGNRVKYDVHTVKKYLQWLSEKPYGTTKVAGNSRVWISAVQIALETQGYDIGKIDWVLGKSTKECIKEFQSKNGLKWDGKPWPKTLKKLVDSLRAY